MTQRELAEKAMFVKAENAARGQAKPWRKYLLSLDGSRQYTVRKDKLGAPYKVYRDISAYL